MAQPQQLDFKFVPTTDVLFIAAIKKSVDIYSRLGNISSQAAQLDFGSGLIYNVDLASISSNADIEKIFSFKSEMLKSFTLNISFAQTQPGPQKSLSIALSRGNPCILQINPTNLNQNDTLTFLEAYAVLREHLIPFDSKSAYSKEAGELGKTVYAQQTEALNQLKSVTENFLQKNFSYAQELDKKSAEYRTQLEVEFKAKEDKLIQEKKQLEARVASIDSRESKHVRRELRTNLLKEIKNRQNVYKLTAGTISLRTPVNRTAFFLMTITGIGFLGTLAHTIVFQDTSWLHYLRNAIIGLSFAASCVFYIRWSRSWFEKHAKEEFALKKFELDIDRASWAVELASEWQSEQKSPIPIEILEKITNNIFIMDDVTPVSSHHPSEDLFNTLLGASSKIKVKIGDNEFEVDRKGLQKILSKA